MPDMLPTLDVIADEMQKNANAGGTSPVEEKEETAVEVKAEEKTPPAKEEPAKKDFLAPKFAALSRREKEARSREEAAQRREREIEERARALEEKERAVQQARRPMEILKAHGLSYADVTADALGSYEEKEPDPFDVKLTEKLSPIEKQNQSLEETVKQLQDQLAQIQTERAQQWKQQITNEIKGVAQESGHELILAVGDEAVTLVQMVIQNYYEQHKKVLSYKEACDKVEEYYFNAVSRLAETPKMKTRLVPPSPVPAKANKPSPSPTQQERPKTLTQSLTQGQRATSVDLDKMPRHEALAHLATQLRYKD